MKTQVVKLQGHEFVVSIPAMELLEDHLRIVKKAAFFRRRAYRENTEALRDILMQGGTKTISKTVMAKAINLVGIPERSSTGEKFKNRFPRTHTAITKIGQQGKRVLAFVGGRWQQPVILLVSVSALFMSINYTFLAFMSALSINQHEGSWQTIETSIGRVRSYIDQTPVTDIDWLFSWQIHLLYAILFFAIAILVLRLRQPKHRLPFALAALACFFFLTALWETKRHTLDLRTSNTSWSYVTTEPLTPRLAYLQQCGDEIPYVFDNQTAGMQFRQFRDNGFSLAAEIPTRYAHPDLKLLCIEYDKLRKNHASTDIVLQLYTKQPDGTLRPYMFSDGREDTAAYGFFVRAFHS